MSSKATYYLDRCRISLSWNTLAAAAQMCQRLGLIRETLPKPETREEKQRRGKLVSWIHMIDKMLSMRLSRPSLIRAGEITLNFEGLEAFGSDGLPPIIAKWIKVCDLQGRVYDDLYCPRALLLGDEARAERARQLAGEIKVAFESKSATEVCLLMVNSARLLTSIGSVHRRIEDRRWRHTNGPLPKS